MSIPGKYIAAYDISDNRERNRLSHVLEGYGFRVQESVFECLLTRAMREALSRALEALGLESGFVNIYKVHDRTKTITIGAPPHARVDDARAYIV